MNKETQELYKEQLEKLQRTMFPKLEIDACYDMPSVRLIAKSVDTICTEVEHIPWYVVEEDIYRNGYHPGYINVDIRDMIETVVLAARLHLQSVLNDQEQEGVAYRINFLRSHFIREKEMVRANVYITKDTFTTNVSIDLDITMLGLVESDFAGAANAIRQVAHALNQNEAYQAALRKKQTEKNAIPIHGFGYEYGMPSAYPFYESDPKNIQGILDALDKLEIETVEPEPGSWYAELPV